MLKSVVTTLVPALVLCLATTTGFARVNAVESNTYEHTLTTVELYLPDGSSLLVEFKGSLEIQVNFEGPANGDAQDDNGIGRDDVPTEIVALDLRADDAFLGPLRLTLNVSQPSLGQFEEQVNIQPGVLDLAPYTSEGRANSFFDVYFELDVAGMNLFTNPPHRIDGIVTRNPSMATDILAGSQPSSLVDAAANPTGWWFRVVECRLNPPVEIDHFTEVAAEMVFIGPDGSSEYISVAGSATVATWFEGEFLGDGNDDDGNGRDEVESELVALTLTGSSPRLGEVIINQSPVNLSAGTIEETVNLTPGWLDLPPFVPAGQADSYFQHYYTVEIGGRRMSNTSVHLVAGTVNFKPIGPDDVLAGRTVTLVR